LAQGLLDGASGGGVVRLERGPGRAGGVRCGGEGQRGMITTPDEQVRIVDLRAKDQASTRPMSLQGVRHITWARVWLK